MGGASHRRIAARAGVPPGSMIYHFSGLDGVLHQTFERFAEACARAFEVRLAAAGSREEAIDAIMDNLFEELSD